MRWSRPDKQNRLYLAPLLLSLKGQVGARTASALALFTQAHTLVLQEEESTTTSDRGAFTDGEAPRFEVEASGQAGPARVGNARTVTPASSSPSPAATTWRSRARLSDDRLGAELAIAEAHRSKPRRGVARRREHAHHVDHAGASDDARSGAGPFGPAEAPPEASGRRRSGYRAHPG
jgi:hypothetical protein